MLINPNVFTLPISEPNALGREAAYQEQLERILQQPDDLRIDAQYWGSVDSTPATTELNTPALTEHDASPPAFDSCTCQIDLCSCDYRYPDTPPTPPDLQLWKPFSTPEPIRGIHFQRS